MSDDRLPYTIGEGESMLRVRVTPRSARCSAGGVYRDGEGRTALMVRVTATPEKGKANDAVIATLAKRLRMAKSRLAITAGLAERNKTVAITGDRTELEAALQDLLQSAGKD